ncbi:MAG: dienelactone hydrolase family protein [Mariniblastus sp.]|nr:dienelactone hydrolase family protein [Mariniblastus sp.]
MFKLWLTLVITLLSTMPVLGQNRGPKIGKLPAERMAKVKFLNPEYLVFPASAKDDSKVPLLIYLHGAGGRGDEINKIKGQVTSLTRGLQKFVKGPCMIVAPQCLKKSIGREQSTWTPEDLNAFLSELKTTLPIDEKRIYLTGNSMGGYGTWVWGANNPKAFAAIAPISGGIGRGGPKDVTPDLKKWAKNLTNVPVYAFVGGNDRVVPSERSERLIGEIRKAGGKQAKLKIYPDEGHNARGVVYATPEFYEWMFSKRRN